MAAGGPEYAAAEPAVESGTSPQAESTAAVQGGAAEAWGGFGGNGSGSEPAAYGDDGGFAWGGGDWSGDAGAYGEGGEADVDAGSDLADQAADSWNGSDGDWLGESPVGDADEAAGLWSGLDAGDGSEGEPGLDAGGGLDGGDEAEPGLDAGDGAEGEPGEGGEGGPDRDAEDGGEGEPEDEGEGEPDLDGKEDGEGESDEGDEGKPGEDAPGKGDEGKPGQGDSGGQKPKPPKAPKGPGDWDPGKARHLGLFGYEMLSGGGGHGHGEPKHEMQPTDLFAVAEKARRSAAADERASRAFRQRAAQIWNQALHNSKA